MTKLIKDTYLKLYSEDGRHLLETPNGERIGGIVFTRVYDGPIKGESYVIAKIHVNIEDSRK
jgi:hypothetical protein